MLDGRTVMRECGFCFFLFCCRHPRGTRDGDGPGVSGDSEFGGLRDVSGYVQNQEEGPQVQRQVGRLRSIELGVPFIVLDVPFIFLYES